MNHVMITAIIPHPVGIIRSDPPANKLRPLSQNLWD